MGLINENKKIRKNSEETTKTGGSSATARKDRESALKKLEELAHVTAGTDENVKGEGKDPNKRIASYKHYVSRYRKNKLTDADNALYNTLTPDEQKGIQALLYHDKETRRIEREEGVDHEIDRWAIDSGTYNKKSSKTGKTAQTNTNGASTNKNVATVTQSPKITAPKQSPLANLFKQDSKKKTVPVPKPEPNPFLPLEKLMS
jgi:hypothetical protein